MENVVRFFETIGNLIYDYVLFPLTRINPITDTIDILLLAVMLYFILKFINNRRAGKLAVGVVLLVLFYLLSEALGLKATSTILKSLYTVGLLAIVIIFQPELRDALEKIGIITTFRKKNYSNNVDAAVLDMVSEIADAACALSTEGYGALIVIQRTTKLGDYLDTGVKIDACISRYLLRNIFVNKAPLHDGAVVISNMRIASAGVKLPLSHNESVLKDLGTRHRAAVGITEVSDAVVVVVSEESQIISIACEKELKRNYNYKGLVDDLYFFITNNRLPEDAANDTGYVGAAAGRDNTMPSGHNKESDK